MQVRTPRFATISMLFTSYIETYIKNIFMVFNVLLSPLNGYVLLSTLNSQGHLIETEPHYIASLSGLSSQHPACTRRRAIDFCSWGTALANATATASTKPLQLLRPFRLPNRDYATRRR